MQKVELIKKKEFVATILNKNAKKFVIYVATLIASIMQVHSFCQAQLELILVDKASIKVLPKYLDYANIFLFNYIIELFENISINEYAIKLIKDKQLLYESIYSLKLVKPEILKTYIKMYLKTGFI